MVEYSMRRLPSGDTIKYRKSPPRDVNGKIKPTKKQEKARKQARARMTFAANYMRITHPNVKPFTAKYSKLVGEVLRKNENESGKKRSRIAKLRGAACRKDGKIVRCKNAARS